MRLCRYNSDRLGLIEGDRVKDVTAALDALPAVRYPLPEHDLLIAHLPQLRAAIDAAAARATAIPLGECAMLSPVANPGKIVAAPVNYKKHLEEARADPALHHQNQVAEIQRVGLFLKATSSVVGPSQGIAVRHPDRRTDHEIELAAVIGRKADRVGRAQALDHVAGYCIGLDITVRGPEERSLRKSIDGYTVLGPALVTSDSVSDPSNLDLKLSVNGEVAPTGQHTRPHHRHCRSDRVRLIVLHADAGRRDPDRHPGRRRADQARRCHRCEHLADRRHAG